MRLKVKGIKEAGYFFGAALTILITTLLFLGGLFLSWICTCGVVKLVTMCFDWTYSWPIATGIWLLMCLARTVFKNNVTVKK